MSYKYRQYNNQGNRIVIAWDIMPLSAKYHSVSIKILYLLQSPFMMFNLYPCWIQLIIPISLDNTSPHYLHWRWTIKNNFGWIRWRWHQQRIFPSWRNGSVRVDAIASRLQCDGWNCENLSPRSFCLYTKCNSLFSCSTHHSQSPELCGYWQSIARYIHLLSYYY
jgi:hypothetical protein